MKCSIYKNAKDNTGGVEDVAWILGAIRDGRWADRVLRIRNTTDKDMRNALKISLPACTFSGEFSPTRSLVNCISYTNLLVFDIDSLEAEKVDMLFNLLKKDSHILSAWRSPSGNGLKGLIRVSSDKDHHIDAFECIKLYFETTYATELDGSGKDCCRLCFVSYDPELFYNPKAQIMSIEYRAEARKTIYGDRDFSAKGLNVTVDDRAKYDLCKFWAEYYRPYNVGDRNNNLFIHACSANRCGIEMERMIVLTIGDRTDMPVQEIKEVITKVYRNKTSEFNTVTVYDFGIEQEAKKGAHATQSMEEILDMISIIGKKGVTTFHEAIDRAIGGLQPGNVYGFAGPEKSYKSTLAIEIAHKNAAEGVPVVLAEGEMSMPQLINIVAKQRLGINLSTPGVAQDNTDKLRAMTQETKMLRVINFSDGTEESLLSTIEAERKVIGQDIKLLVVDSLQNMADRMKDEIRSAMYNSGVLKEVAKKANEGRGVAVVIIMHTDSKCMPWDRQPQHFIRGKIGVRRNLDACFGFSRFVTPDSFPEGDTNVYEVRMDCYHLKVIDYRSTGETVDVVCTIDRNLKTEYSDLGTSQFEVKPQRQNQY